jgi:hypothetical protein
MFIFASPTHLHAAFQPSLLQCTSGLCVLGRLCRESCVYICRNGFTTKNTTDTQVAADNMTALNQRSSVFISGSKRFIGGSKQAATAIFFTAIPLYVLCDLCVPICDSAAGPTSVKLNNPQLQRSFRCIGPES